MSSSSDECPVTSGRSVIVPGEVSSSGTGEVSRCNASMSSLVSSCAELSVEEATSSTEVAAVSISEVRTVGAVVVIVVDVLVVVVVVVQWW